MREVIKLYGPFTSFEWVLLAVVIFMAGVLSIPKKPSDEKSLEAPVYRVDLSMMNEDFKRQADALERIASALEKYTNPLELDKTSDN